MGAIKDIAPAPASLHAVKNGGFEARKSALACLLAPGRHFSPKEVAAELAALGLPGRDPDTIRERCNLPASDPRHIAINPAFLPRYCIPSAELARLLGVEVSA